MHPRGPEIAALQWRVIAHLTELAPDQPIGPSRNSPPAHQFRFRTRLVLTHGLSQRAADQVEDVAVAKTHGTDGSQTRRWREMDSNFWYRGTKAVDFRSIPGIAGDRGALKRYHLIVQPFFFCASNSGGTGIAHPLRPDVWTNDDHVGNARRSTSAWPARAVRAQGSGHGAAAGRNRLDPVDP